MKNRVMIVDGDTGEIYSYNGCAEFDIDWKTAIDNTKSDLDCTVHRAEGVIVIARHGWKILGEEEQEWGVGWLYVRTDEDYANEPNPWATCDQLACNKSTKVV